jgi:hypothetical protein
MSPIVLLVVAEDAKELFHFLVYTFCFIIGLGVEGRRQGLIYVKLAPDFSHKFGSELRASIRDYVLWESSSSPDIIQVELSGFFCSDSFVTWGDNDGFTEAVYHNEYGVSIAGFWEVGDKVHSDGFPYSSRDRVRMQGYLSTWFIFGGLTGSTSVYVVLGELG